MVAGRHGGGASTGGRGTGSGRVSGFLGGGAGRVSLNKSRPLLLYSVRRLASSFQRCSSGFSIGSGGYDFELNTDCFPLNDGPLLSRKKTPAAMSIRAAKIPILVLWFIMLPASRF